MMRIFSDELAQYFSLRPRNSARVSIMNQHFFHSFVIVEILACVFFAFGAEKEEKRFLVVSNSELAHSFWPRVRNTRQDWRNRPSLMDLDTKNRICEDITNDYYGFGVYNEKVIIVSRHAKPFEYRTKIVEVSSIPHGIKYPEIVFTCKTLGARWGKSTYYISEEYKLISNQSSNASDDEETSVGRFIFVKASKKKRFLYGLAECPGEAYVSPNYNVERLYLERRETFTVSRERKEDALCRLGGLNKKRLCVTVYTSNYFKGRRIFSTAYQIKTGPCELKTVSFQTEYGKMRATERKFRERVLHCTYRITDEFKYSFSLSHAYKSNQLFVYVRNSKADKLFLENLTTNARLTFKSGRTWYPGSTEDVSEDHEIRGMAHPSNVK